MKKNYMANLYNGKLTLIGTFAYAYQSLMFHFPALVHAVSQSGQFFQSSFHIYIHPNPPYSLQSPPSYFDTQWPLLSLIF